MKNKKDEEDVVSGTFTWVIDNFSKLKTDKHYSDVFTIGGFKWRILIRPKGSHDPESDVVDQLSMYLGVADASTLTPGLARYTHFSFTLVNQLDSSKSKIKRTQGFAKEFKEERREWGYKSFMPLCELYDCSAGYLVNDICIIEAKVEVFVNIGEQGSTVYATLESTKKERKGQESSSMISVQAADSSPAPMTPSFERKPPFLGTLSSEKVCNELTDSQCVGTDGLHDFRRQIPNCDCLLCQTTLEGKAHQRGESNHVENHTKELVLASETASRHNTKIAPCGIQSQTPAYARRWRRQTKEEG
ncbi:hypothetical protein PRUPE_2G069300 [Prunus persica]|uniref:MATH domain-containing protein n=1 Tax=Prunus persica TaxID=3760 RepID=A0A251QCI1_PRUPE|nr:hypothetical protein PRUPE_2G069300 [Prunus persica]